MKNLTAALWICAGLALSVGMTIMLTAAAGLVYGGKYVSAGLVLYATMAIVAAFTGDARWWLIVRGIFWVVGAIAISLMCFWIDDSAMTGLLWAGIAGSSMPNLLRLWRGDSSHGHRTSSAQTSSDPSGEPDTAGTRAVLAQAIANGIATGIPNASIAVIAPEGSGLAVYGPGMYRQLRAQLGNEWAAQTCLKVIVRSSLDTNRGIVLGNVFKCQAPDFTVVAGQEPKPLEFEPLEVGEIVAYRAWLLTFDGLLTSVHIKHALWKPGHPMQGKINDVFIYGEGGGVHAAKDVEAVREYIGDVQTYDMATDSYRTLVIGTVVLWGEVIEHERGYRAEYAQIASLDEITGDNPEALRRLRETYGLVHPNV